jgi:ABC-type amino acid transport substrate-binding protein
MKVLGNLIAPLAIIALFTSPAWSSEDMPSFVAYDFYPFGHKKNGQISGLFTDLMAEIEKLSGVNVAKAIEPIPRAIQSIARGEIDLILSGVISPAFENTLSLGVVGCHRTNVVTNKKADISSLDDLKNKDMGFVASGFFYKKFGDKYGLNPIQTSSSESMFLMLVHYRVDGIFITDVVFDSYRTEGIPFSSIPPDWRQQIGTIVVAEVIPVHLRMPKNSKFQFLAPKLSKAIMAGNKNGAFERVYRKYGSSTGGRC